jgi:hypothetical protein
MAFSLAVVPSMVLVAIALLTIKNIPSGLDVDEIAT